ncbi:hypothetical protein ACFS07_34450 [Undibacterium arcticum]
MSGKARQDPNLADRIALAGQTEAGAHALAGDIRTLTAELGHDVLALAGPSLNIRKEMFDFIVAEMKRREADDRPRTGMAGTGCAPGWAEKFHAVFDAVAQAMAQTPPDAAPWSKNLNSRLRNYFTLRRQLGKRT